MRGFDGQSSLSAEKGWLLRNEISTAVGDAGTTFYAGLDHGKVSGPSAAQLAGNFLTGAVLGVRGIVSKLQFDIFVGAPIAKPKQFHTAQTTAGFSVNASF